MERASDEGYSRVGGRWVIEFTGGMKAKKINFYHWHFLIEGNTRLTVSCLRGRADPNGSGRSAHYKVNFGGSWGIDANQIEVCSRKRERTSSPLWINCSLVLLHLVHQMA